MIELRYSGGLFKESQFNVKVTRDQIYGISSIDLPEVGFKEMKLDVYEPVEVKSSFKRPGLIIIHGGKLTHGSKEMKEVVELGREMAARGYVCVAPNYRLQGDLQPGVNNLFAAMDDIKTAYEWLCQNADKYGVDPERITIGGFSAGAIIAMAIAYCDTNQLSIKAVMAMWGKMVLKPKTLKSGPPILIIHGTDDTLIGIAEAKKIVLYMKNSGIPYQFYPLKKAGHSPPLSLLIQGSTLYQKITDFLYEHLQLEAFVKEQSDFSNLKRLGWDGHEL